MTYPGRIKDGVAVFDAPVPLPDGTRVRVEVEADGSEFWSGMTVEELAHEQGVEPIGNLSDLAIDWPQDESVDDLLALVREVRH
jgi:hypothetical protein